MTTSTPRSRHRLRRSAVQVLALTFVALLAMLATTQSGADAQNLPGPRVDVSCEDRNGRFDFTLPNDSANPVDYSVTVLEDTRTGTIASGDTATEVFLGLPDDDYAVTVFYDDTPLGPLQVSVTCDVGLPHVIDAQASCLADRGRIDLTITNAADVPTTFMIDVGGVMKELTLDADATGVSTTTGRPNGSIAIMVTAPLWEATATANVNCNPIQTASLTGFCASEFGQLTVQLFNPSSRQITYTVELLGEEPRTVTVGPSENGTASFGALADGEYLARVSTPGLPVRTFPLRGVYCSGEQPDVGTLVTGGCLGTRGRIDVWVRNSGAAELTGTVDISGLPTRNVTVEPARVRTATTATGRPDGTYIVAVDIGGVTTEAEVDIDCDGVPNATEPTVATSCLATRGRVDVSLPNTTDAAIEYRVEFPGLAPRTLTVQPPTTGTITITGRPDGGYTVVVFADDVEVASVAIIIACGPQI